MPPLLLEAWMVDLRVAMADLPYVDAQWHQTLLAAVNAFEEGKAQVQTGDVAAWIREKTAPMRRRS